MGAWVITTRFGFVREMQTSSGPGCGGYASFPMTPHETEALRFSSRELARDMIAQNDLGYLAGALPALATEER